MSIYKRDEFLPEWEPVPWDAEGPQVDAQELGFHQRALTPLVWTKIDWSCFPAEGIFGRDRDWFMRHEIEWVATHDEEHLILIRNSWHGWPDPPEWCLASRPIGNDTVEWQSWGCFPFLPASWTVPDRR